MVAGSPARGQRLLALGLLAAAAVLGVALHGGDGGGSADGATAERAMVLAPRYADEHPSTAARLALAADRREPSTAAELSMLSVAIGSAGVERVFSGGRARISAAIASTELVVTADEEKLLRVWSSGGDLLARLRTPQRIVALADTHAAPLVVAADASGHLSLLDLSAPAHPRLRRLNGPGGDPPLALALSDEATEIVTVSRSGEIERRDTMTGAITDRWSLREASGFPRSGASGPRLAAAAFDAQDYAADERLLVGLPDGAVVRVELKPKRARTMAPAGYAPGRITGVAETSFGHEVAVAATGGYMTRESGEVEPVVRRGPEATAVAFDLDGVLWVGSREGVSRERLSYSYGEDRLDFAGGPASALTVGSGGVVAIDPGGEVSLLGAPNAGIGLTDALSSAFADFDSSGRLLAAEGAISYQLSLLKPGHGREYGEDAPNPERRSYEPDPDWWQDESGFAADAGAIDDEFAVVGGQDSTGTAVVLVWDAKSGAPLRRLPLATGGVETSEPSVVSEVLLLPGKHLLAAYSTVQQLIAIWSTDSWEQVASVPVGAVGSIALSPDEAKIVAIAGSDEETEGGAKLTVVDVAAGEVAEEIPYPGVADAAWSPDGERLAVVDTGGKLRILSADGKQDVRPPIQLEGEGLALAWRPDGEEIAVALGESVVLVDPVGGGVSPPLPDPSYATVHHLRWSPDGRFLAGAGLEWGEASEGYEPAPLQLWTVSAPRLRRRMCQLAGRPIRQAEWTALIGPGEPQPSCRTRKPRPPRSPWDEASRLAGVELLFRRADDMFAADLDGRIARVGKGRSEAYPSLSTSWDGGAVSWAGQGQVGMLRLGDRRAFEWTCVCDGAALREGRLVALGSDGRQLFEFSPGHREARPIAIRGRPGRDPRLIGFLGGLTIVAGYATALPDRSTPSTLYLIDSRGKARRFAVDQHGIAHPPFSQSASGDVLAFVSTVSGGVCYSPDTIGIVAFAADGSPTVTYPTMPGDGDPQAVRSLLVRPDGTVEAAIAPFGCDDEGLLSDQNPDATRYLLRGGRWTPTADRAYDVQRTGDALATLSTPRPYEQAADLSLRIAGEGRPIAADVEQVWVRP